MSQTVRKSGRNDGRPAVGSVPSRHTHGLLGATIPLTGDDAKKWQTAGLEQTQEEPGGQQGRETLASTHQGLGDTPAEDQRWHQNPMRHTHNQIHREGLPGQLGNGRNRPNERVLVPRQIGIGLQTKRCPVAQDGLVEDLKEIHPDQDDQNALISLAADAFVVLLRKGDALGGQAGRQVGMLGRQHAFLGGRFDVLFSFLGHFLSAPDDLGMN